MVRFLVPTLLALASLQTTLPSTDAVSLSIPTVSRDYSSSPRAAAIATVATQIVNGPRVLPIDGVDYPMYHGPLPLPGSLTDAIQTNETLAYVAFGSDIPTKLGALATNLSATLTTIEAYTALYDQAETLLERPISTDNSDETFGEERTTIKSFALRPVTATDLATAELALPDATLESICGLGAAELFRSRALFVEDLHDVAQFNDPKRPDKFNTNVLGFFCVHESSGKLLPIEIRLLETQLTYTPLDTVSEWTLAKMALEAASASYHQMQHMAETHAITIPIRVEAMRTMSVEHPVRALLQRHVFMDFGLEKLGAIVLFNSSTLFDQVIGWGASGSIRFLYAHTHGTGVSMQHKAFHADVARRGLDRIQGHKYVAYGSLYHDAIDRFVGAFLDVYYTTDAELINDVEVQNWANASASIPHVRDFPSAFDSKTQLCELLTHLIFTSTVRHHGMNGQATWHGTSAPFAPAALWKTLPTAKLAVGETLNVLEYAAPPSAVPATLTIAATFYRDVPASESMFGAYRAEPFASEPRLVPAIDAFDAALRDIDATILQREHGAKWPYHLLRPSRLPHYTWM